MEAPYSAEIQFGVAFSAEADLVVVRGTGSATATVTVRWDQTSKEPK